jgi:hypothetical protein
MSMSISPCQEGRVLKASILGRRNQFKTTSPRNPDDAVFSLSAETVSLLGGFLDVQNLVTFVGAALGASAVGQLLFVAGRALGEPHGRQKVVRAAKCGTAR